MAERTELGFTVAGPDVAPDEVEALCAYLRGKGWLKAAEIAEAIDIDDRRIRAIAEFSDGRILSGQKGYRFFDRATPLEEADQAASWLESQGKKMLLRGAAIRRRYHTFARDKSPANG